MSTDLYKYSIEQLPENQGTWPEIARECGVSYSWLCKFANNKIPDASYAKVQRLAEILRHRADARRKGERRHLRDKNQPTNDAPQIPTSKL